MNSRKDKCFFSSKCYFLYLSVLPLGIFCTLIRIVLSMLNLVNYLIETNKSILNIQFIFKEISKKSFLIEFSYFQGYSDKI